MKKRFRKTITLLLCLLTFVSLLPETALAADAKVDSIKEAVVSITNTVKAAEESKVTSNKTYKYTVNCSVGDVIRLPVPGPGNYTVRGRRIAVKFRWYVKKGKGSYKKVKGGTSNTLTVEVTAKKNNWKYRCKVSPKKVRAKPLYYVFTFKVKQ